MAAGINAFEIFAKIGADTSGLKSGLNSAKSMVSKFGGGVKTAFSSLGGAVTNLFKGLLSKVKNFFNQARQKAAAFESAMAQVAATMGKSIDEVNQEIATVEYRGGQFTGNLKEYAMELGATTKYTSTQVAEAMNYMALAGYDVQKTMEMLPTVLNLASAGGMELARASDVVTDVQTAFGASTERTTQMIDEMAKAASTGNTSVSQLGDAFLTVGGLAKEVGGGFVTLSDGTKAATDNIQEIEIALVAMANAGVKGSEAGMHMRNMLLKLASPTEQGTKKLEELGVSVFDSAGNMRALSGIFKDLNDAFKDKTAQERLDAISTLFNARDTTSAQALLAAISGTNWDKIGESVLQYEGAAQKMSDTMMNTMKGASDLFQSAWDNFQITIANATGVSGGNIANLVRFGADAISAMTEGFKANGAEGLAEAFINQLGKTLDKLGDSIPALVKPITKIITMLARKIPQLMTKTIPTLVKSISEVVNGILDGTVRSPEFNKAIRAAINNMPFIIRTFIKENGEDIRATGEFLFETIVTGLTTAAEFIGENILPVITGIATALTSEDALGKIIDAAGSVLSSLVGGLTSEDSLKTLDDDEKGIPKFMSNLVRAIGKALSLLIDAATDIIAALCGYFTDSSTKTQREKGAQEIIDGLGDAFEAVCTSLNNGVLKISAAFIDGIIGGIDYDDAAGDIWEKLLQALIDSVKYGKTSKIKRDEAYQKYGVGADKYEFYDEYERQRREYIDSVPWYERPYMLWTGDDSDFFGMDGVDPKDWSFDPNKSQLPIGDASDYWTSGDITTAEHFSLDDYMRKANWEREYNESQAKKQARRDMEQSYSDMVSDYVKNGGVKGVPVFGNGGIVTRPTLAMIGDDGAEAVVPLEKDSAVRRKLFAGNGGINITFGNIIVQGGQNAGQEVVRQIDEALRQYQLRQERGIGGATWR